MSTGRRSVNVRRTTGPARSEISSPGLSQTKLSRQSRDRRRSRDEALLFLCRTPGGRFPLRESDSTLNIHAIRKPQGKVKLAAAHTRDGRLPSGRWRLNRWLVRESGRALKEKQPRTHARSHEPHQSRRHRIDRDTHDRAIHDPCIHALLLHPVVGMHSRVHMHEGIRVSNCPNDVFFSASRNLLSVLTDRLVCFDRSLCRFQAGQRRI